MNNITNIILSSKVKSQIRTFFSEHDFIEVETPIRLKAPALEDYIDAIPAGKTYGEPHYLRTSPELDLKRLLAEAKGEIENVFQMGPCFRQGEIGSQHQEEFTMLEWYRLHADYRGVLNDTIQLFRSIQTRLSLESVPFRNQKINFYDSWEILTVAEAFAQFSKVSLADALLDHSFEEILTEQVEPNLGLTVPTVLIDYPLELAALARKSPNNPEVCERWELYVCGLELANCYSELVDPVEQRLRFEATAKLRATNGMEVYPLDEPFLVSLEHLPECSGIAVGIDRLCMVFTNSNDILDVRFS